MTHNEKNQHEIADFKKQLCVRVDISSDVSLLLHWSLNWCQVRSGILARCFTLAGYLSTGTAARLILTRIVLVLS